MVAVVRIGADLADDDRLMGGVNLAAQGGGHVEFPADLQAELDTIEHGTGGPVRLGNAGNCSEAQAGRFAEDLQDGRHGTDTLHREQDVEEGSHHRKALSDEKGRTL